MKRKEQKAWWCRKCEQPKSMYHRDYRCMNLLTEVECAKHRDRYWLPLHAEIEVTMDGANRG